MWSPEVYKLHDSLQKKKQIPSLFYCFIFILLVLPWNYICNLWLILAVLFWGVFDCFVTWVRKVTQKLFFSLSPFLTYVLVSVYFEETQLEVHNICFHTLCVFYDIVQYFSNLHCDFFFYLRYLEMHCFIFKTLEIYCNFLVDV